MSAASNRRALLSVTNKAGLVQFARSLDELGFELVSTGGTAKVLTDAGLSVVALGDYTGWPEMLDGRVKTLHPKVHAGILARRDLQAHRAQMTDHNLGYFDLVVVNLYDFEGAVARPDATFEDVVEQIDIGGPTLLRAAAKNHPHVLPIVDPDDYPSVLEAISADEGVPGSTRRRMARKVFQHTARYDALVAAFFERETDEGTVVDEGTPPVPPERMTLVLKRQRTLRYGENPHQTASFYEEVGRDPAALAAAEQLQGKALSYNNLLDLDSAFGLCIDLSTLSDDAVAVFIKHNNPCGAARAPNLADAVRTARAVDPTSAFGAVVAVDRPVDRQTAEILTEAFFEVLIAPDYTEEAIEVLGKKKNLRALKLQTARAWRPPARAGLEVRQVRGGLLVQSRDEGPLVAELSKARVVTERAPTAAELAGLQFSWVVAKHVRSNAIVFGVDHRVVAVGAGQMSRVDSVKLCGLKAPDALKGAQVASDAFFPFRDGVDVLAEAGATAIVQPGGSIRDDEVIKAANEHGVAMLFTGVRHFRH